MMSKRAVWIAALLVWPALSQRASAFGGFWSSQGAALEQSAAAVIFVDNPDATVTAIVRVEYTGPAEAFAWLIPVPGEPTIGISSNTVFERLDAATAPEYWVEVAVDGECTEGAASDAGSASVPDPAPAPVAVDRGSIGPYDYMLLRTDPTVSDPVEAATDWLALNGYDLTGLDRDVLSPYLGAGLNLLAFKLTNDMDAGAIRPVALTYEGELPRIPIRTTAVAAQADLPLQVWVIGPSQAVPENYASLVINDALIDWLSATRFAVGTLPSGGVGPFGEVVARPSNYGAVVSAAADQAGGHGFVTELGAPASQFRDRVWSSLDDENFLQVARSADGISAVLVAAGFYRGWDGWREALAGATTLPDRVTIDEFERDPERYRDQAEVDTSELVRRLDERVVKPVADTAALFYRAPYLTRLYTTLSPQEMTLDPSFTYNPDLAQVSEDHIAKQRIACSASLAQAEAPWRIDLPQGGVVVGQGSRGWPVAEGSLPANLKVVMLGTSGSGRVLDDNTEAIAATLFELAGTTGSGLAVPNAPQHGVMIGGSQSVIPRDTGTGHGQAGSTLGKRIPSRSSVCSVSSVGAGAACTLAPAWLLLGLLLALRASARP